MKTIFLVALGLAVVACISAQIFLNHEEPNQPDFAVPVEKEAGKFDHFAPATSRRKRGASDEAAMIPDKDDEDDDDDLDDEDDEDDDDDDDDDDDIEDVDED